ncbi:MULTISPECIES: hypothetical protein [Leucobacter]|uniref:Uncharacterized protein n=1 Tax=Leucobacter chromiiresistens TaxID=1079994 RepID=A0A1H0YJM1_9MICO|nr:hypothetical protein [Leucobacter chromiiresistens]SDQ15126.1 hypothetical protein SAMN04488565_0919 [Leucobacter chromiiresistens]
MHDQESLAKLQQSWPETTDYLRRVGQVNNDLAVLREISQRDEYEASLTWLDHLAVGVEDLTSRPNAAIVMRFLFARQIVIRSAAEVPEYRELQEAFDQEQTEEYGEDSSSREHLLESPTSTFWESLDQKMWSLHELHVKLALWALETATSHGYEGPSLTLTQAVILLNVCRFLEQEPEQSPGWAAECLRSALSSDFFEKAANPTT